MYIYMYIYICIYIYVCVYIYIYIYIYMYHFFQEHTASYNSSPIILPFPIFILNRTKFKYYI